MPHKWNNGHPGVFLSRGIVPIASRWHILVAPDRADLDLATGRQLQSATTAVKRNDGPRRRSDGNSGHKTMDG